MNKIPDEKKICVICEICVTKTPMKKFRIEIRITKKIIKNDAR